MLSKTFKKLALSLTLSLHLTSCMTEEAEQYNVEFNQEVRLLSEDNKIRKIKKGKVVSLESEPVTVVRKNSKTIVLLPLPPEGGNLKVFMPPEETLPAPQIVPSPPVAVVCPPAPQAKPLICPAAPLVPPPDYGAEFNKIGQAMVGIQNLLGSNAPDEALAQISIIRTKYPTFSYLRFLEASAYIVKGNTARARTLLEQALKDFPDDTLGQQLFKELDGSNSNRGTK